MPSASREFCGYMQVCIAGVDSKESAFITNGWFLIVEDC